MKCTVLNFVQQRQQLLVLRFVCALIWAVELWWGQNLGFEVIPWTNHPYIYGAGRFLIDFIVACGCCFLLRRRTLVVLMWFNLLVFSLISTYTHHFHRPLMPINAWTQWREAWGACGNIFDVIYWRIVLVIAFAFLLKIALIHKSGRLEVTWRYKLGGWLVVAGLLSGIFFALQTTSFKFKFRGDMPRYVFAYGYALPWIGDLVWNYNTDSHRARALACFSEEYNRLTPLEKPLAINSHIVLLQLETVGTAAIEAKVGDTLVMPFLNNLKKSSMVYRIRSFHWNGSCDMDYAATTFVRPYEFLNPYRIPGLPYTNTMPQFMKRFGYTTSFYHGNVGDFYNRENVLEKLGFDELYFKRQLMPRSPETSEIGIRDKEMFQYVLASLYATQRVYVQLVTLDTHAPFTFIRAEERELFPEPKNEVERHFNSLRYLDGCLEKFINEVPPGTTILMFGDHTASIKTEMFQSDVVGNKEYVNGIIYQKGTNLAQFQQTRHDLISMSGELNLLDLLSYLRHSVAASNGQPLP